MQEIVDRLTASDRGGEIARVLVLPYLNHAATMYESGYATHDDIDGNIVSLIGDDGNTDKGTIEGETLVFKLGTLTRQ